MNRLLTKKELDIVVPELAERCRDMVYSRAEEGVRKVLKDVAFDFEDTGSSITMTFNVGMAVGDIVQVLARHERKKR